MKLKQKKNARPVDICEAQVDIEIAMDLRGKENQVSV
jgi:hypothetical protein